jgi:hypothetical protein
VLWANDTPPEEFRAIKLFTVQAPEQRPYKKCADVYISTEKSDNINSNMSDNAQVHRLCPGLTGRPCCDQQPGSTSAKEESKRQSKQAIQVSQQSKQVIASKQAKYT